MQIIDMLNGLSPWWWVIIAFVLGSMEMLTLSFFLIWPGLAALAMAGILLVMPDMSGTVQIACFAILSIVLTLAGRYLINSYGDGADPTTNTLNNRSAHLIGRTALVLDFKNGAGNVEIDGMRWRAKWEQKQSSEKGDTVRITKTKGMTAFVEVM